MFRVEITYKTKLGNMLANCSTSQVLPTRDEAEFVRKSLREMPQLADAEIVIKNAPPNTADEALLAFRKHFAEYPPVEITEKASG